MFQKQSHRCFLHAGKKLCCINSFLTKDKYKYKIWGLGDALINSEEVLIPIKDTGHSLWSGVQCSRAVMPLHTFGNFQYGTLNSRTPSWQYKATPPQKVWAKICISAWSFKFFPIQQKKSVKNCVGWEKPRWILVLAEKHRALNGSVIFSRRKDLYTRYS